jgi:hypothetical protein|tara:strand:- start:123 stop:359 length:237 start_codon:yes stop_codon:yes gene_type:complete
VTRDVCEIEVVIFDVERTLFAKDLVDFIGRNFHWQAHFLNALLHDDIGSIVLKSINPGSVGSQGCHIFDVVEVLVCEE